MSAGALVLTQYRQAPEAPAIVPAAVWQEDEAATNKALILRFYEEVWNKGNTEFVYEVIAPDFTWRFGVSEVFLVGPDAAKENADNLYRNIDGMGLTIDHIVAEDDLVAAHWIMTSTPAGTPGTATTATELCAGIDMWRFENGMAVELWEESSTCA